MKKHLAILLTTILAAALSAPVAFAQASGTVKGTCKDPQGNPIADAVVVWTNQDNGQKYTLKTNKKGEYFSLGLTPGKYASTRTPTI
jgi:putative cell wall-binding protein